MVRPRRGGRQRAGRHAGEGDQAPRGVEEEEGRGVDVCRANGGPSRRSRRRVRAKPQSYRRDVTLAEEARAARK